jgi:hypothetical protein
MPTPPELESLAELVAARAMLVLRTGFALRSLSRTAHSWRIELVSHGLELRLEVGPTAGRRARIGADFRPGGRFRHALARSLGATAGWSPLYSASVNATADAPEVDAVLAHVRSRVIGDPRSEALLAA